MSTATTEDRSRLAPAAIAASIILLAAAGIAALPAPLGAHLVSDDAPLVQPLVELSIDLDDERARLEAHVPLTLFLERVLEVDDFTALEAMPDARRRRRMERFGSATCRVSVEDAPLAPSFGGLTLEMPTFEKAGDRPGPKAIRYAAARFELTYAFEEPPRRVGFVWQLFEEPGAASPLPLAPSSSSDVVVEFTAHGKTRLVVLTPAEPEFFWTSSSAAKRPEDWTPPTTPRAGKPLQIPLGAIAIGLIAVIYWFATRGRRRQGLHMSVVALLVAACTLLIATDRLTVTLGSDAAAVEPPSGDAAIELFKKLHENIYRAFDYTSESDIYDTLARSVDGPLLEKIYGDVYRSLILEEEGGALCRVRDVEVLEADRLDATPPGFSDGAFSVRARWRVEGIVRHWGHTHERRDVFEATYTLAPRQGQWRIVGTQILDHERVGTP